MLNRSEIVLSPNPLLREDCEVIEVIDDKIKKLVKKMIKAMYASDGVGLAAPQIGATKRIVVIDCDYSGASNRNPLVLINPEIVEHSEETYRGSEGCLSIPGVCFEIPRYSYVKVRALDLEGQPFEIEASEDLLCRCLQHEIDHTRGITMFERLDPSERMGALRLYQEALARGAQPGDIS